jgi:hypothetical protein
MIRFVWLLILTRNNNAIFETVENKEELRAKYFILYVIYFWKIVTFENDQTCGTKVQGHFDDSLLFEVCLIFSSVESWISCSFQEIVIVLTDNSLFSFL